MKTMVKLSSQVSLKIYRKLASSRKLNFYNTFKTDTNSTEFLRSVDLSPSAETRKFGFMTPLRGTAETRLNLIFDY